MAKKTTKDLAKELTWKYPHIAQEKDGAAQIKKADKFCEDYKKFLNCSKTERECVNSAEVILVNAGYERFDVKKKYKAGDKVYEINRGKSILATTWGTAPLEEGVRINGAHIDSPRLDLKPNPMIERGELAQYKTHYYGGIRKYQWVAIPLAMHGTVVRKDGTVATICIGEDEKDPIFYISDLLPHLSKEQNERKLNEGIKGEELNIIIGSLPIEDSEDVKDAIKLNALKLINEKYCITERDYARAEIEFVPAYKAKDVGFDRSLIASYGHDDRVCAYPALMAELATKKPKYTTVTILTDKEEIGSVGNTGMDSNYFYDYLYFLAQNKKADVKTVCANSACLSADVNAAYDPTFSNVFEEQNASWLNHGVVLTKYTGARGKSGANDASAEFMAKVIDIMDKEKVYWQIGELGKVDEGGGGTIALYVAGLNIDVVDLGVPVMSMHAPYEVVSKLDVYNTYLAFKAFYNA